MKKFLKKIKGKRDRLILDYWYGSFSQKFDRLTEKEVDSISASDLAKIQKEGDIQKINVYTHVFIIFSIFSFISLFFLVNCLKTNDFSWAVLLILLFSTIFLIRSAYHFYETMCSCIHQKKAWDDFFDEVIKD